MKINYFSNDIDLLKSSNEHVVNSQPASINEGEKPPVVIEFRKHTKNESSLSLRKFSRDRCKFVILFEIKSFVFYLRLDTYSNL